MATVQINNLTSSPYYLRDIYTNVPANGSVVIPGGTGQSGSAPYPTNALDQGRYLGQLLNMEGLITAQAAGTLSFQVTFTTAELASYGNGASNPGPNVLFPTVGVSATTITAASNGVDLSTATTINVTSTTGFAATGSLLVETALGDQPFTYTSKTATTFVGTSTAATGSIMSTGGTVAAV